MYIVTHYGCNSPTSDMWTPESRLFEDYDQAYAYFLRHAPDLTDTDNMAERRVNPQYGYVVETGTDAASPYTVIEVRRQLGGYADADADGGGEQCTRAKRPEGVVIARINVQ